MPGTKTTVTRNIFWSEQYNCYSGVLEAATCAVTMWKPFSPNLWDKKKKNLSVDHTHGCLTVKHELVKIDLQGLCTEWNRFPSGNNVNQTQPPAHLHPCVTGGGNVPLQYSICVSECDYIHCLSLLVSCNTLGKKRQFYKVHSDSWDCEWCRSILSDQSRERFLWVWN